MDELVDRIYEAAVLPELWRGVLQDLTRVADAREAVLLVGNGDTYRWIGSSPFVEDITARHYTYAGARERTRRLLAVDSPGFVHDSDVFTEDEILAEPLFTEFLIPAGLGHGVATAMHPPTGDLMVVHVESAYRYGPLDPQRLGRLNDLRPHLARASLLSARLSLQSTRTAVEALQQLGLAACAVGPTGTVLVANPEFGSVEGTWTTRGGDVVTLLDRRANEQLRTAIAAIATNGHARSIALAATSNAAPAVLHVLPVRRSAADIFSSAVALLVLTRPRTVHPAATPLLRALFDLTPAEARVATGLANGHTLERIAHNAGRSIDTVRNQMKSVMAKTGNTRQADLARLLAQLL